MRNNSSITTSSVSTRSPNATIPAATITPSSRPNRSAGSTRRVRRRRCCPAGRSAGRRSGSAPPESRSRPRSVSTVEISRPNPPVAPTTATTAPGSSRIAMSVRRRTWRAGPSRSRSRRRQRHLTVRLATEDEHDQFADSRPTVTDGSASLGDDWVMTVTGVQHDADRRRLSPDAWPSWRHHRFRASDSSVSSSRGSQIPPARRTSSWCTKNSSVLVALSIAAIRVGDHFGGRSRRPSRSGPATSCPTYAGLHLGRVPGGLGDHDADRSIGPMLSHHEMRREIVRGSDSPHSVGASGPTCVSRSQSAACSCWAGYVGVVIEQPYPPRRSRHPRTDRQPYVALSVRPISAS